MKNVMAAASEAEVGALFLNSQEAAHMRNILKEKGREQIKPTRMTTDNSTADGFANRRIKIKRSKAMDIRFYWIQDRVSQGQIHVHRLQGENNHVDYFTKHHPTAHHRKMQPVYLHTSNLANLVTPDCRGVLIWDASPVSLSSQGYDSWPATRLARQATCGSCCSALTFPLDYTSSSS